MAEHADALASAENLHPVTMPGGPDDPLVGDARRVTAYLADHEDRLYEFLGDDDLAARLTETFGMLADGMRAASVETVWEWASAADEMHGLLVDFIRHMMAG